jgi:hypothetical protein
MVDGGVDPAQPLNRRLETRPLPPPPRHDRRGARYRPLSSDHRGRAATTTPPPLATEVARPPLKLSTKLHDDAHDATLSSTSVTGAGRTG